MFGFCKNFFPPFPQKTGENFSFKPPAAFSADAKRLQTVEKFGKMRYTIKTIRFAPAGGGEVFHPRSAMFGGAPFKTDTEDGSQGAECRRCVGFGE